MTTPTETAMLAMVEALRAVHPQTLRNGDLISRLVDVGDDLAIHINVLDGDRAPPDEMLGADLNNTESYDLVWQPRVEFAVAGGDPELRESTFDEYRKAIWDALKPVMTSGNPVFLGGAVDFVRCIEILSQANTNADGLPGVKACEFVFELSYTSTDPF